LRLAYVFVESHHITWLTGDQVAFYGLGLNSSTFGAFGLSNRKAPTTQASIIDELHKACVGRLILAAGLVPGYWASFLVIDRIGRKPIQYMGFIMLTIIFCIMVGLFIFASMLLHVDASCVGLCIR
jgi:MFS transporter, PHS family, inorganic phosphate transporter